MTVRQERSQEHNQELFAKMAEVYAGEASALEFDSVYQLLVAVMLSAHSA